MREPEVSSVAVARLVAAIARELPEVIDLDGGLLGEVATYGETGPVRGVRIQRTPPRIRLHAVMRFGARLDEVADDVRRRVSETLLHAQVPAFADATVDVHVVDVRLREHEDEHDSPASGTNGRSGS
jgi:uncharacterized alkaline shock family protein YloU